MNAFFICGLLMGTALYWSKWLSFNLFCSSYPSINKFWHKSKARLFTLDLLFGVVCHFIMQGAGPGLIAMIGTIIFGVWSIIYVYFYWYISRPISNGYNNWKTKRAST